MSSIIIPFSKWKVGFLLAMNLILFIFVFLIFFGVSPFIAGFYTIYQIWYIRLLWRRLIGKIPGIVIDEEGIENNSQWLSLGKVPWKDIKAIEQGRVFFVHKVINIKLQYPELNLSREKSSFKKWCFFFKQITSRSYVEIRAKLLSKSHDQLVEILSSIDINNPNFDDYSEHLID